MDAHGMIVPMFDNELKVCLKLNMTVFGRDLHPLSCGVARRPGIGIYYLLAPRRPTAVLRRPAQTRVGGIYGGLGGS